MTTDWRTNLYNKLSDMKYFTDEIEVHIRKLYPLVKRIIWLQNAVRGGQQFGDQPITPAKPHLDFHQNKSLRIKYHSQVGSPKFNADLPSANPILMGEADNEDRTFSK